MKPSLRIERLQNNGLQLTKAARGAPSSTDEGQSPRPALAVESECPGSRRKRRHVACSHLLQ